jgi:S1-C subfamily serine protease
MSSVNTVVLDKRIFFAGFDSNTKKLLYTKYNFNFELYKNDFNLNFLVTDKLNIFIDFLIRNKSSFDKPYSVDAALTKYFFTITPEIVNYMNKFGFTIHPNYINVKAPITYIESSVLINAQFDIINYDDTQIRILQDYYWNVDGRLDTKWNFDFNQYSNDFNIYGSKLLIFTDFVVRCISLSGVSLGYLGYGTVPSFQKYFIQSEDLKQYIFENGVTSIYDNIGKSVNNIDFISYGKLNNLTLFKTFEELKTHYYCYGQFERRIIPLINKTESLLSKTSSFIGTIFSNSGIGTGFLCKNSINSNGELFIVTCKHTVDNLIDNIYATFENYDEKTLTTSAVTAAFRFTGYDIFTDVYVGYFDKNLPYNLSHNVDLSLFSPILIDVTYNLKINEEVFTIGNIGYENNLTPIYGKVISPLTKSSFNGTKFLENPEVILTDLPICKGYSGSPLLVNSKSKIICVGMINHYLENNQSYSGSISGFILANVVRNITLKYNYFANIYKYDIQNLNYQIRNGYNKRWLGVLWSYYHPYLSVKKNSKLRSLIWTGGMVIEDFILGFDIVNKKFVTDFNESTEQNFIKIETPLTKTKMYSRFLFSGRTPIVIKSLLFFASITSEYKKFYIGKFGGQDSYSKITYSLSYSAVKPTSFISNETFANSIVGLYTDIEIEYYYYNGVEWILDTEIISGNGPEKYNVYSDKLGYKFIQHVLELPIILLPYIDDFVNNGYGKMQYYDDENDEIYKKKVYGVIKTKGKKSKGSAGSVDGGGGGGSRTKGFEGIGAAQTKGSASEGGFSFE